MSTYREEKLTEISGKFQIYGQVLHAESCKIGHINETYSATYDQGGTRVRYIHQKINQHVFKNPEGVMDNIMRVTTHLQHKLRAEAAPEPTRRTLTVVPARDGRPFYRDDEGEYWRTFVFVERTATFESVQSPEQALEAGKAFGKFQRLLADLPGGRLVETIPVFHNTRNRFNALQQAVKEDHYNRAESAAKEIDFAAKHEPIVDILLNALAEGRLPERITHNDTKFNNVMLDADNGGEICVVDLDTVMPGLVHYDFGDMVRTTTSPTLEDERDLSKVTMQMPMFEGLARGYMSQAGAFLTPTEKSHIAFAGKLITFTIGLRFLTDYLNGDKYFRVHRSGHNLDRARTQFTLVDSITRQEEKMQACVDGL